MVNPDRNLLSGLVEIDETSIRCRTKNDEVRRGRSHEGKLMIAGAVEVIDRDGKTHPGRIRLSEIPDYTTETLHDFVTSKPMGSRPTTILRGQNTTSRLGEQLAHKVLPWVHRIFANLKAWELGVYHGLRPKRSHLDECVSFQPKTKPALRTKIIARFGHEIQAYDLQYVDRS